jgi:hypothetical protein
MWRIGRNTRLLRKRSRVRFPHSANICVHVICMYLQKNVDKYINPLSRIHDTSLTSAYFECECLEYLFMSSLLKKNSSLGIQIRKRSQNPPRGPSTLQICLTKHRKGADNNILVAHQMPGLVGCSISISLCQLSLFATFIISYL